MQSNDPHKLGYSFKEASAVTSLGLTTLWAALASKRLEAIRIGRRTIITAESLHRLMRGEA